MDEQEILNQNLINGDFERKEVNFLIQNGLPFTIKVKEKQVKKKYLFGLIKRYQLKEVERNFIIKEPTLAVLDRLSKEWIEMSIDERLLQNENVLNVSKKYVMRNIERASRVIALAVLGEDYFICHTVGNQISYKTNEKELQDLTNLFKQYIKPSDLYTIYEAINITSNLADFLTAIRLMSAERTTKPQRIAENEA